MLEVWGSCYALCYHPGLGLYESSFYKTAMFAKSVIYQSRNIENTFGYMSLEFREFQSINSWSINLRSLWCADII